MPGDESRRFVDVARKKALECVVLGRLVRDRQQSHCPSTDPRRVSCGHASLRWPLAQMGGMACHGAYTRGSRHFIVGPGLVNSGANVAVRARRVLGAWAWFRAA